MQSPTTTEALGSKLTRGVRTDAPRRDTTMTQNSDSGDAVGDAGPATDRSASCVLKVKKDLSRHERFGSINRWNSHGPQMRSRDAYVNSLRALWTRRPDWAKIAD